MRRPILVACVLGFAAITGCVSAPVVPADVAGDAPVAPTVIAPVALGLAGTGCREGGGHSVHPARLNPLPAPWSPADVLEDVGPQVVYSEVPDPEHPVPQEGSTIGNYHATVACDAWTFRGADKPGLVLGFVGMKVEQPLWSDPGPTHHYLVTVVATNDPDVQEALTQAGFHAMTATATVEDLLGDWLRVRMSTDHNGDYDSLFRPKLLGGMHATWTRLWFQNPTPEGTFAPIALDLTAAGGDHFVADSQGYFSHSGTHHHAPLPGAYGHTAAVWYTGFDRTVDFGPRPDVRVSAAYDH